MTEANQPSGEGEGLYSSPASPRAGAPPVHIAFDARMLGYRREGGIGQHSLNLLRAMSRLQELGSRSRIDVLQMRADTAPVVRGDPRFRRVAMLTPPHNRFEQAALGLELLRLWPRPSLIHSPDFVPPRYRLFPAVVTIHDLAFLKFPEITLLTEGSKRYYGQVPWAVRSAAAVVAVSQSARDDIMSLLGADPRKVVVIPNAAGHAFKPPADYGAAAEEAARTFGLPAPAEGGYILFVGTIEPRKNITMLLEAYSTLRDRGSVRPMPALVIAGTKGWLSERTYARVEELHLSDSVRFIGAVPEATLALLYGGARAFALPSLYEGFGMPALEALSCGTPVLASNTGALPEVVGDAGILLSPDDPPAWAEALEMVLTDPGEQARLRDAGPRQAAHFSWEESARHTLALYRGVVASG